MQLFLVNPNRRQLACKFLVLVNILRFRVLADEKHCLVKQVVGVDELESRLAGPSEKEQVGSRLVESGDLFIALKGPKYDGHDYAQQALAGGAAAVMVSHAAGLGRDAPRLVVRDTTIALEALARDARHRSELLLRQAGLFPVFSQHKSR